MIRLLIVDDHAIVRQGLVQLFATVSDIEVIGTAADGDEAVRFAQDEKPDVILMDLGMPNLDGVAATRLIADQLPLTRVVVLTSYGDESRSSTPSTPARMGTCSSTATPTTSSRACGSRTPGTPRSTPGPAGCSSSSAGAAARRWS